MSVAVCMHVCCLSQPLFIHERLCYVGNLIVNTVAHIKPKLPVEMKQIIIYNQVMQHGNYYYINIRFT